MPPTWSELVERFPVCRAEHLSVSIHGSKPLWWIHRDITVPEWAAYGLCRDRAMEILEQISREGREVFVQIMGDAQPPALQGKWRIVIEGVPEAIIGPRDEAIRAALAAVLAEGARA